MNRTKWLLLGLLGLALSACAVQPPASTTIPEGSPSVPSPSVEPSTPAVSQTEPIDEPSAGPIPSTDDTADPGEDTPDPIETVAAGKVTLGASSLGDFKFGADEAKVTRWLEARFGEPGDTFEGIMCEMDDTSPYGVSLNFDELTVTFLAKDRKESSARTLQGWQYQFNGALGADFALQDGVDPSLTFGQLQKKYPKSKLEDTGMSYILTLPNKIRLYAQVEADLADMIEAGYDGSGCE
jgi:hypothetical protein